MSWAEIVGKSMNLSPEKRDLFFEKVIKKTGGQKTSHEFFYSANDELNYGLVLGSQRSLYKQLVNNINDMLYYINVNSSTTFYMIAFDNGINYDNQVDIRQYSLNMINLITNAERAFDIELLIPFFEQEAFEKRTVECTKTTSLFSEDIITIHERLDIKQENILFSSGIMLMPVKTGFVPSAPDIYLNYILIVEMCAKMISHYSPIRGFSLLDVCMDSLINNMIKLWPNHVRSEAFVPAINSAGNTLMMNISYVLGDGHDSFLRNHIDRLSSLTYEKDKAKGTILFCHKDKCSEIEDLLDVKFAKHYYLSNNKMVRKLLQIANGELILVGSTEKVWGLLERKKMSEIFDYMQENLLFEINIISHRSWILSVIVKSEQYNIYSSYYDEYYYPKNRIDKECLRYYISELFDDEFVNPFKIIDIIELASNQTQGTTVLFLKNALKEVQRLSRTSIPIEPIDLLNYVNKDSKFIQCITSIDGAIICDTDGMCYALGVILDGITGSDEEDISRGARHNSVHRYLNSQKDAPCLVAIVSEDKDITICSNYSTIML